ncbi:hypothetical protein QBC40DRAFT_272366 [Triangularia verruculosa]|uniref:t-SNARE coiled-coil homology domain-containing protein n=1 Tax=Triangularia verruculosa TaxID=2587418 RepID=A0AAN6XPY3_9PEZI|nr:hypothetical protein QBC40DRAFT_272366 [Triangularia verruculosa]
MSNPNALLLLADHIKLSLLERQRAKNLNLPNDTQDGHISRSLDQFRDGIEALEKEQQRLQEEGDEAQSSSLLTTLTSLKKQQTDLTTQFHGFPNTPSTTSTLTHPNDPSLAEDFAHAQSTTSSHPSAPQKKNVRFTDNDIDLEAQRSSLFSSHPYRDEVDDDDSAGYRNEAESLSNTQIHAYHRQILEEQDAQLDALGLSISRQRELSMRIGDELDSQVLMLDESERVADRQASTLNRARRQLGRVARGAAESGEGRQMTAIVVLIIVLVLLIVILK